MPHLIPLYPQTPRAAVELVHPRLLDRRCDACAGASRARSRCMAADGEPGGVLFVGDYPGQKEDNVGRPFCGESGAYLRAEAAKTWRAQAAFTNALLCARGAAKVTPHDVAACRPFLAQTIHEVRPERIVATGAVAALALLGRVVQPIKQRRTVGWLAGSAMKGRAPVPVFCLMNPAAALRNYHVRRMFEADLRWALGQHRPDPPPWDAVARIVLGEDDALAAERELRAARWFAFDCETAGRMHDPGFRLLSVQACASGSDSPWVWPEEALVPGAAMLAPLVRLLEDPTVAKGGSNVKYDVCCLRAARGVVVRGVRLDVRLLRKLLDPEADGHLDKMAELVGMGGHKAEMHTALSAAGREGQRAGGRASLFDGGVDGDDVVKPRGALGSDAYARVPRALLHRYGARDALATALLGDHMEAALAGDDARLRRTWDEIVVPAAAAFARVEWWGVAADRDAIAALDVLLSSRRDDLALQLRGHGLDNPGSTRQVAALLYGKLCLPIKGETDGGQPSTDKDALKALAGRHPVVDLLREYRRVDKLLGTYARGLLPHVHADGRVHPSFDVAGARSGRLSCSDPNMQTLPRAADSEEGKLVRDCFVAALGWRLLSADYSQIELRVLAALSGDPKMIAVFKSGQDYHLRTAQMVAHAAWGIAPEAVTKTHRTIAKTCNFGIVYGQSDAALAEALGWPGTRGVGRARRMMEAVTGEFDVMREWCAEQVRKVRREGVVWTDWQGQEARRRPMWRIVDVDGAARSTAERGAYNSRVQGTASDYCLMAVVALVAWAEAANAREGREGREVVRVVLAVHDQVVLEVREEYLIEAAAAMRRIMLRWPLPRDVPLAVDLEVGTAFGSLTTYVEKTGSAAQDL